MTWYFDERISAVFLTDSVHKSQLLAILWLGCRLALDRVFASACALHNSNSNWCLWNCWQHTVSPYAIRHRYESEKSVRDEDFSLQIPLHLQGAITVCPTQVNVRLEKRTWWQFVSTYLNVICSLEVVTKGCNRESDKNFFLCFALNKVTTLNNVVSSARALLSFDISHPLRVPIVADDD